MKHRYSFQRDLIYKTLKRTKEHLTAEELYAKVKKSHPSISFGTVYRNLGVLESEGKVRKLNVSSERAVFETEEKPHHHLICEKCGDIQNVYEPANIQCVKCLSWVKNFEIRQAYMNAYGICDSCKKKLS